MKIKMKLLAFICLIGGLVAFGAGIYEEIYNLQADHAISLQYDHISPIIHIFMGLGFLAIGWAASWVYRHKA
ncbi:MAG: hypothetical protein WC467_04260 [Patescibacteria group bacterium]